MPTLNPTARKWLKFFHIVFAALWLTGGLSLVFMPITLQATGDGELYGIHRALKFIDDYIIIPGAFGSLVTGLLYSLFTSWGFFKHTWVTVKYLINIGGIIFGTFWLGTWLNGMVPIAESTGLEALADPTYLHMRKMILIWGSVQISTIIFAVFLSVFRLWRKRSESPAPA